MSNQTIIQRVLKKLTSLKSGQVSPDEFTEFLRGSLTAMDGIDDMAVEQCRNYEYEIEVANFHDDDPELRPLEVVLPEFENWLKKIERTNPNTH